MAIEAFRLLFDYLSPENKHFGVDDTINEGGPDTESFISSYTAVGERILEAKKWDAARKYARHGAPSYLRPRIWDLILQSEMSSENSKEEVIA
jgi:hypothetical protein